MIPITNELLFVLAAVVCVAAIVLFGICGFLAVLLLAAGAHKRHIL